MQYYAQTGLEPKYIEFKERPKYDINVVASNILKQGLRRGTEEENFKTALWENAETEWQAFFGYDKKYFLNEIDLSIRRITNPDLYKRSDVVPKDNPELRSIEKLSMSELRKERPLDWKKLSEAVFKKFTDEDGFYVSATGAYRSKQKLDFHIDHIVPMSKGGLTVLSNLQILTRAENARKGTS